MPEVVLVAGRGPMATRAIRSCQRFGSKAVAVHSDADTNARHARMADESVLIGTAAPEASYLDLAALVEAAQVSGARALLPVHAVLAGSAELARRTREAGLLWIGSDPDSLEAVQQSGWDVAVSGESPGWVIGLADGFRIDGLLVRRTRAAGAAVCWTSAEEPGSLAVDGLPPAAKILATLSDLAVELGWRGLVSIAFGPDGAPAAVRGGLPAELGLVELRGGRDLVQAALALADGGSPPAGSPGAPAAVGGVVRATAVPGAGQRASISELIGPEDNDVQWEPGYATGDWLSPWYDPVLGILAARGDDLASAVAGFLEAAAAVRVAGLPDDLDQLRARAEDIAARMHDGTA
ncbi:MAG: hypothetical protein H0U22_09845 [Geodermatophilaceae bacterium]|nr:hypothetical protein [Geodermatophilaceae bacterium]